MILHPDMIPILRAKSNYIRVLDEFIVSKILPSYEALPAEVRDEKLKVWLEMCVEDEEIIEIITKKVREYEIIDRVG